VQVGSAGIGHAGYLGLIGLLATMASGAMAVADSTDFKYLATDDLKLVYFDPAGAPLAPYAMQCYLGSLAAQKARFDYTPDGGIAVLLQDFSDRGAAMTTLGSPRDRVFHDVAPANLVFETFSPGERLYTIANHELVHLATSDGASPSDARARRFFGGKVYPTAEHPETILYNYLTNPRALVPRWYQEGSATFMETWLGGGLGRAQGGYDEMVFRAMVRDGAKFYDPLGLVSTGTEVDFQVGANAYLYGTRFMSYLALQYSPERLIEWWRRDADALRYYADDFERVFGRDLAQAWRDWVEWEGEFQRRNLASVREHPVTHAQPITSVGLGAISRAQLSADGRKLFAAVRYPGRVPQIVAVSMDDGSVTELHEVQGAVAYSIASLAYDAQSGTIYYTANNTNYRDLMALDLGSGVARRVFAEARIGDLAFNRADRSLWGLRTNNGFVMLVRIPFPYSEWQTLHVFPYGEVPFDLDVSPDGTMLSMSFAGPDPSRKATQVMQVRVLRTDAAMAGDVTPLRQFEFGFAVPEGFAFSPDGLYLYGSAYYTGVSNIYRYEIATGELVALSNAETGFFRPIPLSADELLVFDYTAAGFVPSRIPLQITEDLSAITFLGEQIVARYPEVGTWGAGSPTAVDLEAEVTARGDYKAFREMRPEAWYPVLEGYKDSVGAGMHFRLSDPVGFDQLAMTASYTPDDALPSDERAHLSVDYRHFLWKAGASWNDADFYDLFGPTKRSRKGYRFYIENERPIIYRLPETMSLTTRIDFNGDLDTLPAFQNVASPVRNLFTANVALEHHNVRSSIGSVDDETGYAWGVLGHLYGATGDWIPGIIGRFDFGHALPVGHASLWLRSAAGVSSGDREDPLANAYFGAFGNNYVDDGEVKRYRDVLSMPGFEINALAGKSFAKSMLELNLPPVRFERLGTPGFYVSWARPALFATALVTDPYDAGFREEAYNVGAQLDFQLQVLHRLPMMLSFGYATGFEGGGLGRDEFMVSLKVL
jgi:hypothetical protein